MPSSGVTLGSVAWDWYAAMSEPPPEFPRRTTASTPASSRSQRTPTPISTSARSSRKWASFPRKLVFQPRNPKPRSAIGRAR